MADITVNLISNRALVEAALPGAIERALEAVGLQAEGYAKMKCPVDTGLLRNSITHAVGGKAPALSSYQSNPVHAISDATRRAKTAGKLAKIRTGTYSGTAPEEQAVYIGSNVQYAAYVEYGTSKTKAQPFLKPAVTNHTQEYQEIVERFLKNG